MEHPLKRPALYARLKAQGATILTYIYDLVPVRLPEHIHESTLRNLLTFITAVLTYTDLVLTDSRAAEIDFLQLKKSLAVERHIPTVVTKLGSEIVSTSEPSDEELASVRLIDGQKYLLFVGTIEPRKQQLKALEAFDLVSRVQGDLHIVFVGRQGWDSDETIDRISAHPLYGKRVHWIKASSDALLNRLYRNSFATVYLSRYEGFGLPVAESLSYGKLTISSRNSSLFEVGGDFVDYTYFDTAKEVAETLTQYVNNSSLLRARERYIRDRYRPYTWGLVAGTIIRILENLVRARELSSLPHRSALQFVFISNAPDKLRRAITSWDANADFISSYLVVCPGSQSEEIASIASLHPIVVASEENLLGSKLEQFRASDHQARKWLLRSSLVELDAVDAEFVMLDDDNMPLHEIGLDAFINEDGTYNAFYYNDLIHWTQWDSDYDAGQRATKIALDAGGLELASYSSHQPQVINKAIFEEAVGFIRSRSESQNIDEWSAYFNYAATTYPTLFTKQRFQTLNWPAPPAKWTPQYPPIEYNFENYDQETYDRGEFRALIRPDDTDAKLIIKRRQRSPQLRSARLFDDSRPFLERENLAHGLMRFSNNGLTTLVAGIPSIITMVPNSALSLEIGFQLLSARNSQHDIALKYSIDGTISGRRARIRSDSAGEFGYESGIASVTVMAPGPGTYAMEFFLEVDGRRVAPRRIRYEAKLVVAPNEVTAASMHRRLLNNAADGPVLEGRNQKVVRTPRTVAKSILRRLLPFVVRDRRRLQGAVDGVQALRKQVAALETSVAALTDVVEKLESSLESSSLREVEPHQPMSSLSDDVSESPS